MAFPPPDGGGAADTALTRLIARGEKFKDYVAPEAYESLRIAQMFVTEMRQDFYPAALLAEVAKPAPALEIRAQPLPIRTGIPVHFSLRFLRQALNEVAAVREWTCQWDFGDGKAHEAGWDVYHAYETPGQYPVTVTIVGLDGNTVTTAGPIQREFTVAGSPPVQRHWRWTAETKIEAGRLGFVLAIALFGVFAAARGKVESLDVFGGAAALIALGFTADTLKNLMTQQSAGK